MVLNVGAWGSVQWTFYAIGIGLLSGVFGNLWATAYTHYREEKARNANPPESINWTKELFYGTICLIVICVAIAIFLLFS
jgi:hypothetical protein